MSSADLPQVRCRYFRAGECRSCALIETPYHQQLADKQARCEELLPSVPDAAWLPPFSGGDRGFRNRAKLVIGGSRGKVTLGILGPDGRGVDLRECAIQSPGIAEVIPALGDFLDRLGIAPYDVPARRGELKFVHITEAPADPLATGGGELMLRFVVRSPAARDQLRRALPQLRATVPRAAVISVNLQPEHKAVLEGEEEELLFGDTLPMRLGRVTLHLQPQSFFQTNTAVSRELYAQVASWVAELAPASVWDLYCGVGGFALHCAGGGRRITGVELSPAAVRSAARSAAEAGVDADFVAGDATGFAQRSMPDAHPDALIVNPPRRGIGAELAEWIEDSDVPHVIYSSCNPESLARDLRAMPAYQVRAARLFDMFPHTRHVEVACVLERR